jgi:hypothetical protein
LKKWVYVNKITIYKVWKSPKQQFQSNSRYFNRNQILRDLNISNYYCQFLELIFSPYQVIYHSHYSFCRGLAFHFLNMIKYSRRHPLTFILYLVIHLILDCFPLLNSFAEYCYFSSFYSIIIITRIFMHKTKYEIK